jgi:glycosyltransferase involved in cell wall biosynthesis
MVVRPVAGGVAHVSAEVVAELRRQGRSVLDVPLAEATAPAWHGILAGLRAARRIRHAGIVHVEFGRTTAAPFWFAAIAVSLRRDVVVVAHDAPVLVHAPGAAVMATRPGWRDAVAHRILAPLLDRPVTAYVRRRAGALAVLSHDAARRCAEAGNTRVGVISHGADPPVPGPPPSRSRTVVFAGFLSPAKGLEDLLGAWQRAGPDSGFRLVIAGTSDRQHAAWVTGLRERSRGWPNPPDWRGRLDDHTFHALIAGAAIVVLPYRAGNPSSGILVRAMVQGRAVLATRVPATRSLIASGVDGQLVSAAELAGELAALMRDPQRRDRLGAAAALVAADRHTWARQVADLDLIYTGLGESA